MFLLSYLVVSWASVGSQAMLREEDNYSVECHSPGWKYCSWKHQSYECDRTSSTAVEWCDRSAGLRWTQGPACGLDFVSLSVEQAGTWQATLLQGPHLNISHRCMDQLRVAEKASVSVGRLLSHYLVGQEEVLSCESSGGNPDPLLQAFLVVDSQRKPLQISDKTAGRSFIQCEGTQSDEDDIIYTVTSKQQINIVFPPQPTDALEVVTQVNESVKLNLTIEAFPLTTVKNLVWNIIDGNTSVKLDITSDFVSRINVTLTIHSFQEEDYYRSHFVTAINDFGSENYTVQFLPYRDSTKNDETTTSAINSYIITSVLICSVILIVVIVYFIFDARKKNKLCWKPSSEADNSFNLTDEGKKSTLKEEDSGSKAAQKSREVKHSRSRTPSPLLRSNKNHERVDSTKSDRSVVKTKISLGIRESTYPVV